MEQLKIFIDLTRLNKPTGFMLLFWPCSWGLSFAFHYDQEMHTFLYYLLLFFIGSILMRSAGCIVNDIVDRNFDKKVERTKLRPIPSGRISVKMSLTYALILCIIAFFILIQFNIKTIILGLGSMIFAFSYPFMKRITYWPQLFLGLTFNWGIIMGWVAILDQFSLNIFLLYFSAIFWTLGYDTIYGVQDVEDDEIIGVKSTAIKFKKNIKLFVGICYLVTFFTMLIIFKENLGKNLSTLFMMTFFLSLIVQIKIFSEKKPLNCLRAFKLNNFSGLTILISILLI